MKNRLLFFTLLLAGLVFTACKQNIEERKTVYDNTTEKGQLAQANFKKASLSIEGMTCEIGCARTIQSKLAKTDGITFAEINFDKKSGIVKYDANKISEKQIVAIVEQIADGDLYKVAKIKSAE